MHTRSNNYIYGYILNFMSTEEILLCQQCVKKDFGLVWFECHVTADCVLNVTLILSVAYYTIDYKIAGG